MKRLVKVPIFITIIMVFFMTTCRKDNSAPPPINSINYSANSPNTFTTGGGISFRAEGDIPKLTILGELRENPYTVAKMTEAYNNINTIPIAEVATTHLYVKFCTDDPEELKILFDEDLVLWDFPLEFELLELGDYYDNPNAVEGEAPCFYAVIDPDYTFPAVSYEILNPLHIADYASPLAKEAFSLTGEEYIDKNLCADDDPNWPDCQCDLYENVDPVEWAECIDRVRAIENAAVGHASCVYSQSRKPGGHIYVEDTELGEQQPVRNVKVVLKDNWFGHNVTYTDDNGCFKINKEYSGKAWIRVKFKNKKCKVRGVGKNWNATWQWLFSVVDHHKLTGPVFNDIEINYNMWVNAGSQAHRYWGAATVVNGVEEYYEYAANDGIDVVDRRIDIYTARKRSDGYALMGVQYLLQPMLTTGPAGFFITPFTPLTLINSPLLIAYLPDVMVGTDHQKSDRLKWAVYHEIAHTSHYSNVGLLYWKKVARAEILAFGHGSASSFGAGRIALAESWADHIGKTYAHRTYGVNNSLNVHGDFQIFLEAQRNEDTNHVPIGYYNDLLDGVNSVEIACDGYWAFITGGCGAINDQVSGFSNTQIFSSLTSSVKSPSEFTDKLIEDYLDQTSNTEIQVRDLFNSY